jgi:hypothetical protein
VHEPSVNVAAVTTARIFRGIGRMTSFSGDETPRVTDDPDDPRAPARFAGDDISAAASITRVDATSIRGSVTRGSNEGSIAALARDEQ